jgi:Uma2 family endonuclease
MAKLVLNYFDQNPMGSALVENDCSISRVTVRRPDVSVFLGDRWKAINLDIVPVPYAPDIAVEVISHSENVRALARKIRDYFSARTQEVWLLDAENGEVTIRTNTAARILQSTEVVETPLLPGFSVTVEPFLAAL